MGDDRMKSSERKGKTNEYGGCDNKMRFPIILLFLLVSISLSYGVVSGGVNIVETQMTFNITADAVAPTVENLTRTSGDIDTESARFLVDCVDTQGVVQTVYLQSDWPNEGVLANHTMVAGGGNEYSYNTSRLSAGLYEYSVWCIDDTNNSAQSATSTWTCSAAISGPPKGGKGSKKIYNRTIPIINVPELDEEQKKLLEFDADTNLYYNQTGREYYNETGEEGKVSPILGILPLPDVDIAGFEFNLVYIIILVLGVIIFAFIIL